ncbi:sensor histidine kinase [Halomonas denitrificans]|nr:sensor histidine kinase [Halomonas denitrificans]
MTYDRRMAPLRNFFAQRRHRRSVEERVDALVRENERLFAELGAVQQEFSRLARSSWKVQEDERRHLASELHDHLGQMLTALVHRLERPDADRPACAELARQALEDTRELSRILRPQVLDDLGLGPALEWLARRAGETAGIEVDVSIESLSAGVDDPDLESLLFRIAQEALNNVVKHARAERVRIALSRSGDRVELRIRDDGVGFAPDRLDADGERGIGLTGMTDRVGLFGGDLTIVSAPGKGTSITASVRLQPSPNLEDPTP